MRTLRDTVHEALGNAVENGYGDLVRGGSPFVVAMDLRDCCADLEAEPIHLIADHVRTWQAQERAARTQA